MGWHLSKRLRLGRLGPPRHGRRHALSGEARAVRRIPPSRLPEEGLGGPHSFTSLSLFLRHGHRRDADSRRPPGAAQGFTRLPDVRRTAVHACTRQIAIGRRSGAAPGATAVSASGEVSAMAKPSAIDYFSSGGKTRATPSGIPEGRNVWNNPCLGDVSFSAKSAPRAAGSPRHSSHAPSRGPFCTTRDVASVYRTTTEMLRGGLVEGPGSPDLSLSNGTPVGSCGVGRRRGLARCSWDSPPDPAITTRP